MQFKYKLDKPNVAERKEECDKVREEPRQDPNHLRKGPKEQSEPFPKDKISR